MSRLLTDTLWHHKIINYQFYNMYSLCMEHLFQIIWKRFSIRIDQFKYRDLSLVKGNNHFYPKIELKVISSNPELSSLTDLVTQTLVLSQVISQLPLWSKL